jgi:5-methylcytosine-specific restriction endonuclease McrA
MAYTEADAAAQKRYRERHPDRVRAAAAAQYAKNPKYQLEWRKRNPEAYKAILERKREKPETVERQKRWEAANPDKVLARQRRYREKHRAELAERTRLRREADPDPDTRRARDAALKQQLRVERPDECKAQRDAWVAKNRDKMVGYCAQRNALIKGAPGSLSDGLIDLLLDEQGHRCPYCWQRFGDGLPWTLDHYLPLRRGGAHNDDNIQLACFSCNCRKSRKDPTKFVLQIMHAEGAL